MPSTKPTLALIGGAIYTSPSAPRIADGVVLVRDGKIVDVSGKAMVQLPANAEVVDCSGMTILAGFWNSHVHFFERKWEKAGDLPAPELARQLEDTFTRYGFTSVFDTGSMWTNTRHIRDRVESGEVMGPRIRSTGEALLPPGAMPPDIVLALMGTMKFPAPEVADAAQASAAARMLLESGVDGIKVFASGNRSGAMSNEAMAAAVQEAHGAGKPVFVHPNSGKDVLTALSAGVDIIAHTTPSSGRWEHAILDLMMERRAALIPTLTIWKWYARHDRVSAQDRIVKTETEQLHAWLSAGGEVLFGTDLGAVDPDPSDEYMLMASGGMNFLHILTSLTTAPAGRFGAAKNVGQVARGLEADLVVLEGDPARDLRALTSVRYTVRAGEIVYRAGAS